MPSCPGTQSRRRALKRAFSCSKELCSHRGTWQEFGTSHSDGPPCRLSSPPAWLQVPAGKLVNVSLLSSTPRCIHTTTYHHASRAFVPGAGACTGATRHISRHATELVSISPSGRLPWCVFHQLDRESLQRHRTLGIANPATAGSSRAGCGRDAQVRIIHDVSVVNVPHIHDAHQWQSLIDGTRRPMECCSCVRRGGSVRRPSYCHVYVSNWRPTPIRLLIHVCT